MRAPVRRALSPVFVDKAQIPGGLVQVGTDRPYLTADGEGPARKLRLKPFLLAKAAVSHSQFADFIAATGYITEAEQLGWSYVFYRHVAPKLATSGVVGAEWWRRVEGACWRAPFGPCSNLEAFKDHPVVHISWRDAAQFAAWVGGRLPSEAEWEHAAKGGLSGAIYPWGDRHPDDDFTPCNIWQGRFPEFDSGVDGYEGLAPSVSFEPNGFGLYNMAGNCWEWTADAFRVRSLRKTSQSLNATALQESRRVLKGGSYLCHASYCHRYRIAARMGSTGDSTTGHIGFRVAFDI
ncbi:formylglycine-generating enzyme family protein [Rhizobium sp. SEMIA 4085]|nr:formylglycine-generating enzyme family protein [Rhizobium sp. SEMIA 4085]NNH29758.1 formylglycine-generating enzyme family protein [Rhizobium sp. SEMIA 4085]